MRTTQRTCPGVIKWLALSLLLSAGLIAGPLSSGAGAAVSCTNNSNHCYSVLSNSSHQYGGLFYAQKRAEISNQTGGPDGGWHVDAEGWFEAHCTGETPGNTFVELGIWDFQGKYEVFWDDYVNGKQSAQKILTTITQDPNVSDNYLILNLGNGQSWVVFDSFQANSEQGTGFNGSCLQEGGEIFSNSASTNTFSMTGDSYSDYPAENSQTWGTGDYPIIVGSGMMGQSYGVGQWDWSAS